MKIYFFGADYPPTGGGIATYTYEWINATAMHDDVEQVNMMVFGNKSPRKENIGKKIKVETYKNISFLYVGYKVFISFLQNRDHDVFHSLNLFPLGFWTAFWGKFFRKKTCVTFYGTDACDTSASKKTFLLKRWTLRNISYAITISNFTKQATEKRYDLEPKKIKVIYPVVPRALLSKTADTAENQQIIKIKETYNITDDTFVIISVARLVKRKGIEYLIRATAQIKDSNIKLFIIGNGPEKDALSSLVNDLNMKGNIFVMGKVEDIIPFYRIASVGALVSYNIVDDGDFEGLGLVLLEAQSYGVPVIGSRSGGIPEAFEEGITGITVEPQDVSGLAKTLIILKNDKNLRDSLAKNTDSFLKENFGLKNTIGRYIELCKSI